MPDIINSPNGNLTSTQLDYVLVDGSSSMLPKWWDFMAAADIFINSLRAANVNSRLIVQVFDTMDIDMVQRDGPLSSCETFKEKPLGANFTMTPLYDAINVMGRRLREIDPARASILIVTDGESNQDMTTIHQAKAILDWCKAKGWQVTFLGCDFNNSRQAKLLGMNEANCIGVARMQLTDAAAALGRKRAAHAHGADDISFSPDEKQQFGGYLTGPAS